MRNGRMSGMRRLAILLATGAAFAAAITLLAVGMKLAGSGKSPDKTAAAAADSLSGEESKAPYDDILTEAEKKEWAEKKTDSENVFIQLNTKISLQADGKDAYIRLINPPYSSYSFKVVIFLDSDESDVLYGSEQIAPGTVLEYVDFNKGVAKGTHAATVRYEFYSDGSEVGTQDVPVTLEAA